MVLTLGVGPEAQGTPAVDGTVVREEVRSEAARFRVVRVARGLEHPWALEFLPGGEVLVTERTGGLWRMAGDDFFRIEGVPEVRTGGQGGLLDVIAHPEFAANRVIYLSYAATYGDGFGTRIARAVLRDDRLVDVTVLLEMMPPGRGGVHFGSRFAFDAEGYLYATFGERGDRDRSQRLDAHHGKVVRLREDGRVPPDNPFVGQTGAHAEIWTYGHRNQQGMVFDPVTGLLWTHEHGPRGGDALHVIRPGKNYGWPLATHGREYSGPGIGDVPEAVEGVEVPVLHWTPSIAPCGLDVARGSAFPGWEGNLFAGALAGQHIRRVVLEGERVVGQEELLRDAFGRIREVAFGPDGMLWFATDDGADGGIYRIEPVAER
jgi:glucose/arabinose dehydrogenase